MKNKYSSNRLGALLITTLCAFSSAYSVSTNDSILFLGKVADVHAACFENVIQADSATSNLNLSIENYVSGGVLKDYYGDREVATDTNALLNKLDGAYDYIIYIPKQDYLRNTPELHMEALRLLKNYTAGMGTEVMVPMIWMDSDAVNLSPIFEEYAYRVCDTLDVACAPAGLAWNLVLGDTSMSVAESSIVSSPSDHATYTLAASNYSHLFEQKATGSTYLHGSVTSDEKNKIIDHAYDAWLAAQTDVHYAGEYTDSYCHPWLTPHDSGNRTWASMGTSTEGGVKSRLGAIFSKAGYSNEGTHMKGYDYDDEFGGAGQYRYFSLNLSSTNAQAEVITNNFDFTFGRWISGWGNPDASGRMDVMHSFDPDEGGDTKFITFVRHKSNNPGGTIRAAASASELIAGEARSDLDMQGIPNHIGFARAWEERPDLVLIPTNNTHLTQLGLYLQAGQIFTIVTGQNPALVYDGWTDDEKYVLNLAYQTVMELGGLQKVEMSAPSAVAVTVSGTLLQGEILTGVYQYKDVEGDIEAASTYRWIRSKDAYLDASDVVVATTENYTLQDADLWGYLFFEVTPVAASGEPVGFPVMSPAIYIPVPEGAKVLITVTNSIDGIHRRYFRVFQE